MFGLLKSWILQCFKGWGGGVLEILGLGELERLEAEWLVAKKLEAVNLNVCLGK